MSKLPWSSTGSRSGSGGGAHRVLLLALIAAVAGLSAPTPDSEAAVDGYKRAMTTLRLLSYDRNVGQRIDGDPTFLIVTAGGDSPDGEQMRRALERTSTNFEIAGGRPSIETMTYSGSEQFESALAERDPVAAYIADGLGEHIEAITGRTRQHSVLTFVATRSMVEQGGAVSIVSDGRGYEITVNLPAVRAEGADFPARVLKIADDVLR